MSSVSEKKNKSLKPGWRRVKFGDVVQLSKARSPDPLANGIERYVGLEHLEPDDLRIRSWGNVAEGVTFTSIFQPGQVLFGKRRAYQRKVAVADFSGVCSGDIYVLETRDPKVLLPELLPFICQTDAFFDHAVGTSAGSLSPRTNWTSLANFNFALPPMKEQSEIAQVLMATRECADSYEASEAALRALLLSRTDELFSGQMGGEAKAQIIGDIADVQYGLTLNAKRRAIRNQSPYLRVANVQRFHIDLSEVRDIGVDGKDDGCILRGNDILVVEGHADITELGRASIWEEQLPICLHQNHLIRIRCRPEADPYYVLEYVNSPAGRAYFRGRGKSTSGLNTLNSTVVREMPIPIPPLATQKSIADELKAARQSLKEIAARKGQHATVSKRLSTEIFGGGQG
jgi:type I restriction enzyme S subunit